jgi:hypothetical protein
MATKKFNLNELKELIKKTLVEELSVKNIENRVNELPDKEFDVLINNLEPEFNDPNIHYGKFGLGLKKLILKINPDVYEEDLNRIMKKSKKHQERLENTINLMIEMGEESDVIPKVKEFLVHMVAMASRYRF